MARRPSNQTPESTVKMRSAACLRISSARGFCRKKSISPGEDRLEKNTPNSLAVSGETHMPSARRSARGKSGRLLGKSSNTSPLQTISG